ncbi:MAG: DsbA family oxidoreductase [Arenicellales bacterium]
MDKIIKLSCYSDILCFWAYAAQVRLDELQEKFANQVKIDHHFISVFGNTEERIGQGWKNRGGYDAFSEHILDEAKKFPFLNIHPDIWKSVRPKTSAMSHCFLKAVQLLQGQELISNLPDGVNGRTVFEETLWRVRCAFFEKAEDIGKLSVLMTYAEELHISTKEIEKLITDGSAMAALISDMDKKQVLKIEGSPTYILNDGRQKLYGNIGYRVIEANVVELLENDEHQLSWC